MVCALTLVMSKRKCIDGAEVCQTFENWHIELIAADIVEAEIMTDKSLSISLHGVYVYEVVNLHFATSAQALRIPFSTSVTEQNIPKNQLLL